MDQSSRLPRLLGIALQAPEIVELHVFVGDIIINHFFIEAEVLLTGLALSLAFRKVIVTTRVRHLSGTE